jgi:hypothetical protein
MEVMKQFSSHTFSSVKFTIGNNVLLIENIINFPRSQDSSVGTARSYGLKDVNYITGIP